MKKFKGTKGEWVVSDKNPMMVLTDNGAYRSNAMQVVNSSVEELKANAKLIAAAPDLLSALQHFMTDYKNGEISMGTIGNAELAINKVLG